jgi:hypothetical protein
MATWAMKQRYAWIDQALDEGRPFGRRDLVEKFFITTQTATATLNEYRALYPGKLSFDKAAKVFVRDDQPKRPVGLTALEGKLLAALRQLLVIAGTPITDRQEHVFAEARAAIAQAEVKS